MDQTGLTPLTWVYARVRSITTTHLGWRDSSPETNLLHVLRVAENSVERM